MGIFSKVLRRSRRRSTAEPSANGRPRESLYRRCKFEEMEERRLMAADPIHIGAVYYEPASGQDKVPNTFTISWNGGVAGTELTHLEINTDVQGTGVLAPGDPFFNTTPNPPGVYGYSPFQVVSSNGSQSTSPGVQITSVSVVNGGMALDLSFSGFTAGKTLVFTIDVDEMNVGGADAVVTGFDFEGAKLTRHVRAAALLQFFGNREFLRSFRPELRRQRIEPSG